MEPLPQPGALIRLFFALLTATIAPLLPLLATGGAAGPDCNGNGVDDLLDLAAGTSTDLNGNGVPDECESVIYVDRRATGADDGTSWQDAFRELQTALLVARAGDFVWVAGSRYQPDFDPLSGLHDGNRVRSFDLVSGVRLLGGFRGNETSIAQRDPSARTLLSGDIGVAGERSDDSYHVVTGTLLDAQTLLDGFVIAAGNASAPLGSGFDVGAGLFAVDGYLSVRRCTFASNHARSGGAVWIRFGRPRFRECRFAGNSADLAAGGVWLRQTRARFVSCDFDQNVAWRGAALEAHEGELILENSRVARSVNVDGPAVFLKQNDSRISNTTIANNVSGQQGAAGVVALGVRLRLHNSIVWGNGWTSGPVLVPSDVDWGSNTNLNFKQNDIGYCGVVTFCPGQGVFSADPLFVDPAAGNLRLAPGSPCIDAGNNGLLPADDLDLDGDGDVAEKLPLDLDRAARQVDEVDSPDAGVGLPPLVDIGTYEVSFFDCNGNGVSDFADVAGGTSLDCNANLIPDECEPDCNGSGQPDDCDVADGTSPDQNEDGAPDECVPFTIWHVSAGAAGADDGSSWVDAFREVQDALDAAAPGDLVWVAEGAYRPDWDSAAGVHTQDRTRAFVPRPGVGLYGGFAGNETSIAQRNLAAHETVLCGDLLGDDGPGFANRDDNSRNVVRTDVPHATFVLDGFTVRGGRTYFLPSTSDDGAGLRISAPAGTVVVRDCRFESNWADGSGGGVQDKERSTFVRCHFEGNRAGFTGGGLATSGRVLACTFVRNEAAFRGGGAVTISDAQVADCVFARNRADEGGGLHVGYGQSVHAVVSCTFAGNYATAAGAGLRALSGRVENCVIWDNRVGASVDESAQIAATGTAVVRHCDVQGLVPGGALDDGTNFDLDPGFLDPAAYDFRLLAGSPCIDRGDDLALPADAADLDGDGDVTELLPLDRSGLPREVDDPATPDLGSGAPPITDVGAEEFQPPAEDVQ